MWGRASVRVSSENENRLKPLVSWLQVCGCRRGETQGTGFQCVSLYLLVLLFLLCCSWRFFLCSCRLSALLHALLHAHIFFACWHSLLHFLGVALLHQSNLQKGGAYNKIGLDIGSGRQDAGYDAGFGSPNRLNQ